MVHEFVALLKAQETGPLRGPPMPEGTKHTCATFGGASNVAPSDVAPRMWLMNSSDVAHEWWCMKRGLEKLRLPSELCVEGRRARKEEPFGTTFLQAYLWRNPWRRLWRRRLIEGGRGRKNLFVPQRHSTLCTSLSSQGLVEAFQKRPKENLISRLSLETQRHFRAFSNALRSPENNKQETSQLLAQLQDILGCQFWANMLETFKLP
jgi:hypothetical protein